MRIHEYQAKRILNECNVSTPRSFVINDCSEIVPALRRIETSTVLIKAQVHAGGRGKVGGVVLAETMEEAIRISHNLIGTRIVTNQTDKEGKPVDILLFEEPCTFSTEYYLSFLVNRRSQKVSLLLSAKGGMDIESVSQTDIAQFDIDPIKGLRNHHIIQLCNKVGISKEHWSVWINMLKSLYQYFVSHDASLIEINPMVLSEQGVWLALDAKIEFDDNALFRQPEIQNLRDRRQDTKAEVESEDCGLSYISLPGEIGCLVNGAGLAMATMDAIQLAGGKPANFLDIGGAASEKSVSDGLRILLENPLIEGVFINIFGGIVRCDIVAKGILNAVLECQPEIPIVVRLDGNQKKEAISLLKNANKGLITTNSLTSGAKKIVTLSRRGRKK